MRAKGLHFYTISLSIHTPLKSTHTHRANMYNSQKVCRQMLFCVKGFFSTINHPRTLSIVALISSRNISINTIPTPTDGSRTTLAARFRIYNTVNIYRCCLSPDHKTPLMQSRSFRESTRCFELCSRRHVCAVNIENVNITFTSQKCVCNICLCMSFRIEVIISFNFKCVIDVDTAFSNEKIRIVDLFNKVCT